jgi:hypothetical protein
MNRQSLRLLGWVVATTGALWGGSAGVAKEEPAFVRITPAEVQWRDIPDSHGAQEAVLLGDPEKPGMYVVRVKFPPHVMDSPHWHPNARYVSDDAHAHNSRPAVRQRRSPKQAQPDPSRMLPFNRRGRFFIDESLKPYRTQ